MLPDVFGNGVALVVTLWVSLGCISPLKQRSNLSYLWKTCIQCAWDKFCEMLCKALWRQKALNTHLMRVSIQTTRNQNEQNACFCLDGRHQITPLIHFCIGCFSWRFESCSSTSKSCNPVVSNAGERVQWSAGQTEPWICPLPASSHLGCASRGGSSQESISPLWSWACTWSALL